MPLTRAAPHKDLTYRIIGVAMEVHSRLGAGHAEEVYQKALELKLPQAGLSFEAQKPVEVMLEGTALALHYLDFLVEQRVILEIKAKSERMCPVDQWQVIKYFAALDAPVALWINFGRQRLEYHRLFPPRKVVAHRQAEGEANNHEHPLSVRALLGGCFDLCGPAAPCHLAIR